MHHREELGPVPAQLLAWENEGGAVGAPSGAARGDADSDAAILQRLGAALVREWNLLPMPLQRTLYEGAALADAGCRSQTARRDLARYLHDHKRSRRQG